MRRASARIIVAAIAALLLASCGGDLADDSARSVEDALCDLAVAGGADPDDC